MQTLSKSPPPGVPIVAFLVGFQLINGIRHPRSGWYVVQFHRSYRWENRTIANARRELAADQLTVVYWQLLPVIPRELIDQ